MPDQPSWKTSTLSQISLGSVIAYEIGCLTLIAAGWRFKSTDLVFKGFDGLRWSAEAFAIGYFARGVQKANGNGTTDATAH